MLLLVGAAFWFYASLQEFRTGQRLWPWSGYAFCGRSQPASLPNVVRIGLYEEFPVPWRLNKLDQVDFPVALAVAARSQSEFVQLRATISARYPWVRTLYWWPLLAEDEGYYPGPWSAPAGVARLTTEAADLPVLWDLEIPRGADVRDLSLAAWQQNRRTLTDLFTRHTQPIQVWRTHVSMGLNPAFLRLLAMHFDPQDYAHVSLHLDLYTTGAGQDAAELRQIIRCGVEEYGERFIPSFGVLNDQEGPANLFVPPETLRRNLQIARDAGAAEVWLFAGNGLNDEYLQALHATLPLERLPAAPIR